MWDPYAEFQSATLPNGLTVHAAHWPERPWEAVGFLIHSGAEQDPVGLEGLIHFVEHLVSQNTPTSFKEMEVFFKDHGGSADFGSTGFGSSYYRFFAPAEKAVLSQAFSMFGQMLLRGKLEKFVERERQVIIGEIHRAYPVKFTLDLDVRERKALYAGHWPERFVRPFGNPEAVGRITQADLQQHYDAHYTPANMSIVCVGGMKLDELTALLSETPFAISKSGIKTPQPSPIGAIALPQETRYVFEYSKVAAMPELVKIGSYRSVAVIPTKAEPAIKVLSRMLNEVLDDEIRQSRAWTYEIGVTWCNRRHFYEFAINCGAFSLEALDAIENVIEACVASITDREDLFVQAKRHTIANNRMCDPRGRSVEEATADDLVDFGRIISLTEFEQQAELVEMSEVCSLLEWLRPERRWTLIKKP